MVVASVWSVPGEFVEVSDSEVVDSELDVKVVAEVVDTWLSLVDGVSGAVDVSLMSVVLLPVGSSTIVPSCLSSSVTRWTGSLGSVVDEVDEVDNVEEEEKVELKVDVSVETPNVDGVTSVVLEPKSGCPVPTPFRFSVMVPCPVVEEEPEEVF